MLQRRFFVTLALFSLLFLSACTPEMAAQWNQYLGSGILTPVATPDTSPNVSPIATPTPTPLPPEFDMATTENYLLMGTDLRPEDGAWRTDSIMVIALDRLNRRMAILSIPRDLWIEIPGIGQRRINQVDYYGERVLRNEGGGPALMSQVLNNTLGVEIQHWFRLDMNGFREVVDLMGGVTVELECPYFELIYNLDTEQFEWFTLPAGPVTMDGETAYWFVRLRYYSSDFGRTGRQRQFLWALRQQATQSNMLTQLPSIWQIMNRNFTTDLNLLQVAELAGLSLSMSADNIRAASIPQTYLERYITEGGADVLRIKDPTQLRGLILDIWNSPSLASANEPVGACPPLPATMPSYIQDTIGQTALPERPLLVAGQTVELSFSNGRGMRLRGDPNLSAPIVRVFQEGEKLLILDPPADVTPYPVEQDGHRWYRIQAEDGQEGWMSDIFFRALE